MTPHVQTQEDSYLKVIISQSRTLTLTMLALRGVSQRC